MARNSEIVHQWQQNKRIKWKRIYNILPQSFYVGTIIPRETRDPVHRCICKKTESDRPECDVWPDLYNRERWSGTWKAAMVLNGPVSWEEEEAQSFHIRNWSNNNWSDNLNILFGFQYVDLKAKSSIIRKFYTTGSIVKFKKWHLQCLNEKNSNNLWTVHWPRNGRVEKPSQWRAEEIVSTARLFMQDPIFGKKIIRFRRYTAFNVGRPVKNNVLKAMELGRLWNKG